MQQEEELAKLSRRYFQLAVVSFFLMAFLHGLSSFFFTVFFWPALGFGVLAFYYQRAAKREEQAKTAQWHDPDGQSSSGSNNRRITLMVIVSALSLLVIIISLISSRKSNGTSSDGTTKTDEVETQGVVKSDEYEKARQEYNSQNYKRSISTARNALISDPGNKELMLVLGDDYGALKQNDSSFVWFDQAYQNGARSAYLSHWLGYLYDDKGNTTEGIQFYKDALKQDSARTQIYDRLAELEPERAAWYKMKSRQWAEKK